ncbi:MAG: hypothetical protein IJ764_06060 [Bacteroidales bacterium]|nr:hypothetical protein [Bacteroidales bacterium]
MKPSVLFISKTPGRATVAVCLTVLLFAITSCHKDNTCGVPHGYGVTLDLSLPQMYALSTVGGSVMIDSSYSSIFYDGICYRGIFVLRTSLNEFMAYECSCPRDNETTVQPADGWGGWLLQCPRCKSIFSLYAEGAPVEGSQTPCSLYQYNTYMDNDGYHLHIY